MGQKRVPRVPRLIYIMADPSNEIAAAVIEEPVAVDAENESTAAVDEPPVSEEASNPLKKSREEDDETAEERSAKRQTLQAGPDKERFTGKCIRWVREKSFGFLNQDGSDVDIFCHSSCITDGTRLEVDA